MDYRGHCRLVCMVNSVEYLSYSFFCEERCLSLERDAKSVYPCQFMEKKGLWCIVWENSKISSEYSDFSKVERNNGVIAKTIWLEF